MKTRNFLRNGQSVVGEPYRYANVGWTTVFLLNGFVLKENGLWKWRDHH